MLPWMALSVGLFVAWQGLRRPDPRLLAQATLLGVACSLIYVVSGSLWWAVLLHWLAALCRWQGLAGRGGAAAA
jgi:predicted Abi (CAAX) family protease